MWCRSSTQRLFFIAIVIFSAIGAACDVIGKQPFMMVQVCVNNSNGVSLFKSIMNDMARSEEMDFVDQSEAVQLGLNEMRDNTGRYLREGTVYILVRGRLEFGLIATNFGLRKYQIAIGFSEGNAPSEARLFAQRAVFSLGKHWPVEILPNGKGAFPMETCGS